jgi:hypothetical protein
MTTNRGKLGKLVATPLSSYKDAKEDFRVHENNDYHKKNLIKSQNFVDIVEGQKINIETAIDSAKQRIIESNRQKLIPVIKTIIFCGVQNIPLRGHRDDGFISLNDDDGDETSINRGNFRALLKFRVDAGDKILEEHLQTAAHNATFISKTTQNELIQCCGEIIQNKIVKKVKASQFYSVLADETTDIGISEQLSVCIRYFNQETCTIEEAFLGFTKVTDLSGENLANTIIETLKAADLDFEFLRGQGYDGGANMSGAFKGVQARILNMQPLAIYTHCANHRLNLALNKASTVPIIRNTVGIITSVNNFLRESALRTQLLSTKIGEILPTQKASKAKKICETRWVERHDGILHFLEILPAIVCTLDEISSSSSHSSSKAQTLSAAICKFEFLLSLKILTNFLAITLPLSIQLQSSNLDYNKGMSMVEAVKSALNRIRDNSEYKFKSIFEEAKSIAEEMDVEIRIPRITAVQQNRANVRMTDPMDFFRVNIYLPYLDFLISELDVRFDKQNNNIIWNLQKVVPKYYFECNFPDGDIVDAARKYESDLPSGIYALSGELLVWKELWMNKEKKS